MATFFNLPVPAGNGSGASVDVSTLGGTRTITVDKSRFSGILLLEASDDNINFASVVRFDSGSQRQVVLDLACQFVRVTRSGFLPETPTVPVVQIGATTATGGVFGTLAVAAGDGAGAAFDISLGGDLITIIGAGSFNRAVYIEGSQDAGVTWSRITDLGRFETARIDNTIATFNRLRTFSEQSGGNDAPIIMVGSMPFGGSGGVVAFKSIDLYADQLTVPNADWVVTTVAPTDLDNTAARFSIVEFDDTIETGRGFPASMPSMANEGYNPTNVDIAVLSKPALAPAGISKVGLKAYYTRVQNDVPVGAWVALAIGDVLIPANTNPQYQTFNILLGAGAGQLNVAPGEDFLIEFTRVANSSGVNLVGDWYLERIKMVFKP